jgi:hypothetical protein
MRGDVLIRSQIDLLEQELDDLDIEDDTGYLKEFILLMRRLIAAAKMEANPIVFS